MIVMCYASFQKILFMPIEKKASLSRFEAQQLEQFFPQIQQETTRFLQLEEQVVDQLIESMPYWDRFAPLAARHFGLQSDRAVVMLWRGVLAALVRSKLSLGHPVRCDLWYKGENNPWPEKVHRYGDVLDKKTRPKRGERCLDWVGKWTWSIHNKLIKCCTSGLVPFLEKLASQTLRNDDYPPLRIYLTALFLFTALKEEHLAVAPSYKGEKNMALASHYRHYCTTHLDTLRTEYWRRRIAGVHPIQSLLNATWEIAPSVVTAKSFHPHTLTTWAKVLVTGSVRYLYKHFFTNYTACFQTCRQEDVPTLMKAFHVMVEKHGVELRMPSASTAYIDFFETLPSYRSFTPLSDEEKQRINAYIAKLPDDLYALERDIGGRVHHYLPCVGPNAVDAAILKKHFAWSCYALPKRETLASTTPVRCLEEQAPEKWQKHDFFHSYLRILCCTHWLQTADPATEDFTLALSVVMQTVRIAWDAFSVHTNNIFYSQHLVEALICFISAIPIKKLPRNQRGEHRILEQCHRLARAHLKDKKIVEILHALLQHYGHSHPPGAFHYYGPFSLISSVTSASAISNLI